MTMNQNTLDAMPHLQLVQLSRPTGKPRVMIELTVDGRSVSVPEGSTILNACQKLGIEVPTLCWLETLKPVNVCRVCVVEVEGARVLVPSCSRQVEPGMKVQTRSERVNLTRRLVLEMLASSVDLSTSPGMAEMLEEYDAKPERFGECETVAQPTKVDNDLYVRDYGKCVLCYKCVEACGTDHQNTFAIAVAGRGFHAHISTEFAVELPESACVYCGNCIAVCPTGALMSKREWELREAGQWDESKQTATDTVCPFCGVGCTLTLHVQDGEIVKATSPLNNDITVGNLCIKGRFGWRHVQNGRSAEQMNADATPSN
jgi:predicted molibdopterin-dependent oxidoreductase YjgC